MARFPKSLDIQKIASSDLVNLGYTVPKNTVTSATLIVTNASNNVIDVSVYINDTTDDFILTKKKIAAGIGKAWRVIEISDKKLGEGFTIKVQATTNDPYNVFLSGSEVIDDALV